jgi:large subunit ribosomal protein L30
MNEEKPETEKQAKEKTAKIAVIRIRGLTNTSTKKKDTLEMLRLYRKNYCIVLDKRPGLLGMIRKVEDRVAWGEIDDSTLKELIEKRGEKTKLQGKEQIKRFFRLNSPKGGFERKGVKTPFSLGGALGYRGQKINELIRRML